MFTNAKVIQLGEIEDDLHKNFMDLESQVKPSTPLEVLEEKNMTTSEDGKKKEEAEAQVSVEGLSAL